MNSSTLRKMDMMMSGEMRKKWSRTTSIFKDDSTVGKTFKGLPNLYSWKDWKIKMREEKI